MYATCSIHVHVHNTLSYCLSFSVRFIMCSPIERPVPSEEAPEHVQYYSTEEPTVLEVRDQYGPPEIIPTVLEVRDQYEPPEIIPSGGPAEEPEKEVEEISVGTFSKSRVSVQAHSA